MNEFQLIEVDVLELHHMPRATFSQVRTLQDRVLFELEMKDLNHSEMFACLLSRPLENLDDSPVLTAILISVLDVAAWVWCSTKSLCSNL